MNDTHEHPPAGSDLTSEKHDSLLRERLPVLVEDVNRRLAAEGLANRLVLDLAESEPITILPALASQPTAISFDRMYADFARQRAKLIEQRKRNDSEIPSMLFDEWIVENRRAVALLESYDPRRRPGRL